MKSYHFVEKLTFKITINLSDDYKVETKRGVDTHACQVSPMKVKKFLLQTYISMTYIYMGSSLLLGIVTYISVCGSLQAQSYRFIRLYDAYIRHRQIEPISKVGLSTSKKVGFICFNESFL